MTFDPHVMLNWPNPVDPARITASYAAMVGDGTTGVVYTATLAQIAAAAAGLPAIWAHRGASEQAPENTIAAYDIAAARGFAIESDWLPSSDGALVAMHDDTIDRTCTTTGTVSALTLATLVATNNGTKFNSVGFASERVPTLDAFLQRYAGKWVLPENKDRTLASGRKLASAISAMGQASTAVFAQFDTAPYTVLSTIKSEYPSLLTTLYLTGNTAPDLAVVVAAGISILGVDSTSTYVTAAWVTSVHAAGLKVAIYTIDTITARDAVVAMGVDYIITGRPQLLTRGTAPRAPLSESWSGTAKYMWGDDWLLVLGALTTTATARPFNGYVECTDSALLAAAVCAGRPLPLTGSWTMTWTMTPKALNADTTRYCGVQFCLGQDDIVSITAPVPVGQSGYTAILRQNGEMRIDRFDSGANSVNLAVLASTGNLVVDTPVTLQLTVTNTGITFTRLDNSSNVTTSSTTYRGGKAGFYWNKMGARIGPVNGT